MLKKRNMVPMMSCLITASLIAGSALSVSAESGTESVAEAVSTTTGTFADIDTSKVPEGGYTVALCNFSLGNTWRVQMEKTFEQQAEMYKEQGIVKEYYTTNSDGDASQQVSDMEDLITKGVDIICLTAASPTALIPAVEDAMDEGITVISFDAGVDTDNVTASLTVDNYAFGKSDAEWLGEQLGGKGKIVLLAGQAGSKNAELRVQGASETLESEFPDIEIISTNYCDYDYATAKTAMESLVSAHDDIDGILSLGGAMSRACIDVYESAGRDLVPITGEANNGFLKMWAARQADGFTSCCPISPNTSGADALDLGLAAITGGSYDKVNVYDMTPVTDETLGDYVREDLDDNYWAPSILDEATLQEMYGSDAESE